MRHDAASGPRPPGAPLARLARLVKAWQAHLTGEVDGASLALFRIGFGALLFWEVVRYVVHDRIARYYIEPRFFFSYLPFLKPWGGTGMYWHFAALGVLALACAAGLFYRVTAPLLCAAITYVFLLDKAQYLNHLYLVCLLSLLLATAPAHRALSVDRARAARRSDASGEGETVPRWSVLVLRAQVALVYFYGGIAKLNEDWLRGEPLTTWLAERQETGTHAVLALLPHRPAGLALSYGGLFLDLAMGFLLMNRRTFAFGAALCVTFNLMNALLFTIGIFPWLMITSLVLFPDPSWPRRRLPWLFAGAAKPEAPARSGAATLALPLLHGYMLAQLAMPLRHWLYPGDVAWNEAGHRFSWRMKLRDKDVSEIDFYVVDPRTGVREAIDLDDWLTPRQVDEMSTRPDLLVDFAHHVADRWQAAFGVRPIVTAKVVASLNGGPSRDLIDPDLDLASRPPHR